MPESRPPKLTLYHRSFCLFCSRVRHVINQLDLEVEDKNIWRDQQAHQDLQSATGRSSVPVLCIQTPEGELTWLPESNDIIQYLLKLTS